MAAKATSDATEALKHQADLVVYSLQELHAELH